MGGKDLLKQVHANYYPIHEEFTADFDQIASYLQERGIEFQSNSAGQMMENSFSAAVLKRMFNLFPHEINHHFNRNLKRGIL